MAAGAAFALLLAACASTAVEPGYYRVQSGDTLTEIAREQDRSVAELMRWNNLSSANQIDKGQVLRVKPPAGANAAASSTQSRTKSSVSRKPSTPKPVASAPVGNIKLIWPADGKVARGFDGAQSHGLSIVNTAGTPIVAAAPGTVAYASNGLRGYGNLVIVKHSSDYLTIYAHNSKLLVKQGQAVKQGQKIAEMGSSDSKRVELYFELRRGGSAVDPARALPSR
jgi:lipoprotein YgeR